MKTPVTKFIFTAVLFIAMIACNKDLVDTPVEIKMDTKSTKLITADNAFGFDLFQRINLVESENFTISPFSLAMVLAMTYNGAKNETQTAIEEALHLSGLSPDEINQSYQFLSNALLSADDKITLKIAQSIWYCNSLAVFDSFKQINQNYYNAEVSQIDFSSSTALETINGWIAGHTQNKITNMIDQIDGNQVMFLINAIYYNAIWKSKFDKAKTSIQNFTKEDGTIMQVEMMEKTDSINYQSNNLFSSVELPYGRGNFNMVVLLPNNGKTCNDIVVELNPKNWENWMNGYTLTSNLILRLPKFKTTFNDKFNTYLCDMGMDVAFHPGADFSGITNQEIWIDYVQHNTFIDVNEEGTEAAAASVVVMEWRNVPTSLIVNKPFIYAITEKQTGAILFIGKIVQPIYN